MRILFVTPYVPSKVRIRPYAFIRELAARSHEVTLVCLVQPAWEAQYLPEVTPYCRKVYPIVPSQYEPYWRAVTSLPTRMPLSVAYCQSEKLHRLIQYLDQHEHFDLVHTEFIRAAPFTMHLNGGKPKVYDAVDSLALAYRRSLSASHVSPKQRIVSLIEWLKMRGYEPWLLSHYDRVMVSSPADRQALERDGKDGITIIPNGVDIGHFVFQDGSRDTETLVFLGKMSYHVNVSSVLWFYHKVFPLIRREHPKIKFQIVGRDPVSKIKALAIDPSVEVTGTVPDVRPYLANGTVSVCPMVSGSGIQNKMLEAMAVGAPCVATSLACQALQVERGHDVLIADSAEGFAASVLTLLDHEALRYKLAANARRYVERNHEWGKIGESLNQIYVNLLGAG